MPELTVEGIGTFEVPAGTRLIRALTDQGVDILYRCGGYARCATCQVAFLAGEPAAMTQAEYAKLEAKGLLGTARLACQIVVEGDMAVRPLRTRAGSGLPDAGPLPAEELTPAPQWRVHPEPSPVHP